MKRCMFVMACQKPLRFAVLYSILSFTCLYFGVHLVRNKLSKDIVSSLNEDTYVSPKRNWIVLAPRQMRQINIDNYLNDLAQMDGVMEWNILVVLFKLDRLFERHAENVYVISDKYRRMLNYHIVNDYSDSVNLRRMVGYLFAIENGAHAIYDADETIRLLHLPNYDMANRKRYLTPQTNGIYNPFQHFGQSELWPRGFDVPYDVNSEVREYKLVSYNTPCIQHSIWQGFPDLNHQLYNQYRNQSIEQIFFDPRSPPIVIPNGVLAPHAAANTIYTRDVFWSLFLPPSKRNEADIFRSLWTEKLLPKEYTIMFQLSNTTKSIIDEDIYSVSSNLSEYLKFLSRWKCETMNFTYCLNLLNKNLLAEGFWNGVDAIAFAKWMRDLYTTGYQFNMVEHNEEEDSTSKFISEKQFLYFPVEKRHPFKVKSKLPSEFNELVKIQRLECPELPTDIIKEAMKSNYSHFSEDVLHIVFNRFFALHKIIPALKLIYKHQYPTMIICGPSEGITIAKKNRISYISSYMHKPNTAQNQLDCDVIVQLMNYNTSGVMRIHDDNVIHSWQMNNWNKSKIWLTPPHHWLVASVDVLEGVLLHPDGSYQTVLTNWDNNKIHRPNAKQICIENNTGSASVMQPPEWFHAGLEIPKLLKVFKELSISPPGSLKYRCHTNLMLRLHGSYRIDFAQADHYYLPRRLFKDFAELLLLFLKYNIWFENAIPSVLKCLERPEYHQIIPFRHLYTQDLLKLSVENYHRHSLYTYVHSLKIGLLLADEKLRKSVFCDLLVKDHLTKHV